MKQAIGGNSGCEVSFIQDRLGNDIVKKFATVGGGERLSRQRNKHSVFYQFLSNHESICTPKITSSSPSSYEMEYFCGLDIPTFIDCNEINSILSMIEALTSFVHEMISNCDIHEIDLKVIERKINDLYDKVGKRIKIEKNDVTERINSAVRSTKIPVGLCHGDLTFSNVLIDKTGKICVFDFLDSFYETPMQDIVKLRQDTNFLWSKKISSGDFDDTRYKIISAHMDKLIDSEFRSYDFYANCYHSFQLINFIRILPYIEEGSAKDNVVTSAIEKLWSEQWI